MRRTENNRRVLEEKLGVKLPKDAFKKIFVLLQSVINDGNIINNEFNDVYLVIVTNQISLEAFTLQEEEISSVRCHMNTEAHNLSLQKQLQRYSLVQSFDFSEVNHNDIQSESNEIGRKTDMDWQIQEVRRRRKKKFRRGMRHSAVDLLLLEGIRACLTLKPESNGGDDNPVRVIFINPFNLTITVQNNGDMESVLAGSLGDYLIGPGFEMLPQRLVENDPNRYGIPPAKKEVDEVLAPVKVEETLHCSVCLDDCEIGVEAKQMPCKHKFQGDCLLSWLMRQNSWKVSRYQLFASEPKTMPYRLDENTGYISYKQLEKSVVRFRPNLIVPEASACARLYDYARILKDCDKQKAIIVADMAPISGVVVGVIPSPFGYADVVMTTIHKLFRGPRGAMIFLRKRLKEINKQGKEVMYGYEDRIEQVVFPGLQGGPHNHTITGLAVALKQARTPEYKAYQDQVLSNCSKLTESLLSREYDLVSGGTKNHLVLDNLRKMGIDGSRVEKVLQSVHIAANNNIVPGAVSAVVPGGVHMETPALTSREVIEEDSAKVAEYFILAFKLALKIKAETQGTKLKKDFVATMHSNEKFQSEMAKLRGMVKEYAKQISTIGVYVDANIADSKIDKKGQEVQLAQHNYILAVGETEAATGQGWIERYLNPHLEDKVSSKRDGIDKVAVPRSMRKELKKSSG